MLSQICHGGHIAQRIKVILLHGKCLNIYVIHFSPLSVGKVNFVINQSTQCQKLKLPLGLYKHNNYLLQKKKQNKTKQTKTKQKKNKTRLSHHVLLCALQLIHFMNMNELIFGYFFVVNIWTFCSTELNTLSENEPTLLCNL